MVKLMDEEYEGVKVEMQDGPYKVVVESLVSPTVATRPNLAFSMSVVSQHMAQSGPKHWVAMNRIMRYLQGIL